MKSPVTLVTVLYDLGRERMDKKANNYRPFSLYLSRLKYLLTINAPLVIFIPPPDSNLDLAKVIEETRRSEYPIRIVIRSFTDLDLYRDRNRIEEIMIKSKSSDPRLEFHSPDYIVMIYSKFQFLREAIEDNYFNSDYFFWIDAGYFLSDPNMIEAWPEMAKISRIGNKFLVQNESYTKIQSNQEVEYFKTCKNDVIACLFGGKPEIVIKIGNKCLKLLESMMNLNLINNEQQALSILISRHPDKFILYPAINGHRNLMADLAVGGYFRLNYPICKSLMALTVVTREIKDPQFQAWVETGIYYGYQHQVLGRTDKWGGWTYRTQTYLQAVRSLDPSIKIVILADGTDVFFTGPAKEAYSKFKDHHLILGAESVIAYSSTGKYDSYVIEDYFSTQCSSRFCYPNGGFIMGLVPEVIKLLEANVTSLDDQAGYMDLGYQKMINYSLDYSTTFTGNVPNLGPWTDREISFWSWDSSKKRYYNPVSFQYPIAMHFPGNNRKGQKMMYKKIFGKDLSGEMDWNSLIPLGIVIVLILIIGVLIIHFSI